MGPGSTPRCQQRVINDHDRFGPPVFFFYLPSLTVSHILTLCQLFHTLILNYCTRSFSMFIPFNLWVPLFTLGLLFVSSMSMAVPHPRGMPRLPQCSVASLSWAPGTAPYEVSISDQDAVACVQLTVCRLPILLITKTSIDSISLGSKTIPFSGQ